MNYLYFLQATLLRNLLTLINMKQLKQTSITKNKQFQLNKRFGNFSILFEVASRRHTMLSTLRV